MNTNRAETHAITDANTLICQALGLDPAEVSAVNIRLRPQLQPMVTIVRKPWNTVVAGRLDELRERFVLAPREVEP